MGMEIERKFRLDSVNLLKGLMQEGLRVSETSLCQVYTRIDKEGQERIRSTGSAFIKTQKRGKGLAREEIEEEVSAQAYHEAFACAIGNPIEKKRYSFKLQSYEACIDVFEGALSGLVLLEVEFDTLEHAYDFTLPAFEGAVEVTEDERYKNHMLAVQGIPLETVDLNLLFHQASQRELDMALFRASMSSYDGFRVIFTELYAKIEFHKTAYLETKENEQLHQFRVNIRKTRSLLQSVPELFDAGIAERFIKGFKTIATQTNTKRDLDVFGEFLATLATTQAIALHVEASRTSEDQKISEALTQGYYNSFLLEWKMVLEDEEGFFKGKQGNLGYRTLSALALKIRLETLARKLKKLTESKPLEAFHKVRIEFKRLRYLLEYCESQFPSKTLKQTIKKVKMMQETFGLLQDRDVQMEVLDAIEAHPPLASDVEVVAALEALRGVLGNDIYAFRLRILCKKKKLITQLTACVSPLERYLQDL
ncbi:MAG: CHAD domain-containing protein [Campylobacterales bacterium]|nr:CHAD domain-containing protein [Campylobacterales bacterium]